MYTFIYIVYDLYSDLIFVHMHIMYTFYLYCI